jgi:hypothetical protein
MSKPINRRRGRVGLAASLILLLGLTAAGCGSYGLVTAAGIAPGELERILAQPDRFRAYGCAPTIGPRAGETVAMYWDVKGDGVRIVGEDKPSRDKDRWQLIAPDQVVKVYRAVLDLVRQNETFPPRLYRILSEKGRLIGYYFSAIWGTEAPVIKVRDGLYTIREVNLERFKWGDRNIAPLLIGVGFGR